MRIEAAVHAHGSKTSVTLDLTQSQHLDTLRKILSDTGGRTKHLGGVENYIVITETCMYVFDRTVGAIMESAAKSGSVPQAIKDAMEGKKEAPKQAPKTETPAMIQPPDAPGGQKVATSDFRKAVDLAESVVAPKEPKGGAKA